ncbi:hypothetical protein BpHYR1_008065 [Brachionus plicatilis]|uniref:Uncharacterized protein n=1 Tax=Brachionus plicatilis TaxID=10195 RepID=A0A3M7T3M1_BRAPC|nr:hypothetical protein BpHYR1_008065 [Brachionus plicatilis]
MKAYIIIYKTLQLFVVYIKRSGLVIIQKMGCGKSRCCQPKQECCIPVVPVNPCQQYGSPYGGVPMGVSPYGGAPMGMPPFGGLPY